MIRAVVATLLLAVCTAAGAAGNDSLAMHLAAVRAQLDPRAQAALDRISGTGRQLLAARGYLRAGSTLDERWSWSEQQIEDYAGSPAQISLDAAIERVRTFFESQNAGYTLFVNPEVRSLDLQLQRWNQTASVAAAASHLETAARVAIRERILPAPGTAAATEKFTEFLKQHTPQPIATLAVPGLSAHGQMSAVDFQVRQGGRTIAGPDSRSVQSVWIRQGWRERLNLAVQAAGAQFKGPLQSPDEPWHYTYEP